MTREELIEQYIKWGLSVIPVTTAKTPAVDWKGYQNSRPSDIQIRKWFSMKRDWHPGAVMGRASQNTFRLDFDDKKDFDPIMRLEVIPKSAPIYDTPKGKAILLRSLDSPQTIRHREIPEHPMLEIQGQGAIGVLPDTPGYAWTNDLPDTIPCIGHFESWFYSAFPSGKAEKPEVDATKRDDFLSTLMDNAAIGGRHNAVVSAVSWLKARKIGYASTRAILQAWVDDWKGQEPPYTQEEFEHDFEDVFQRYAPVERSGLPAEVEIITLERLRRQTVVAKTPLIDGFLMPSQKLALVGWEGVGKSTLAITLAVEAANGQPVFGVFAVPRPLRIAYLDMEIGKEGTLRFFNKVTAARGDPPEGSIGIFHCREKGAEVKVDITRLGLLEGMRQSLLAFQPDLLILDGWYMFVSENDQEQIKAAFDYLDNIRATTGCSVMICHHTRKVGAPQFTPQNILELASGWGLMRWAEVKVLYKPVVGMPRWAIINGKTRIPEWNPISVLVEYIPRFNLIEARDEAQYLSESQLRVQFPLGRKNRTVTIPNVIELLGKLASYGMSQGEIAKLAGVSQPAVSRWLAGKGIPGEDKLKALAQKLGELEVDKAAIEADQIPDIEEEDVI